MNNHQMPSDCAPQFDTKLKSGTPQNSTRDKIPSKNIKKYNGLFTQHNGLFTTVFLDLLIRAPKKK